MDINISVKDIAGNVFQLPAVSSAKPISSQYLDLPKDVGSFCKAGNMEIKLLKNSQGQTTTISKITNFRRSILAVFTVS